MPTHLVCKKNTIYAGIKIFNSLQPSLSKIKNDKAKFIEAIRKYLNTHPFYSVDEFFICENDICTVKVVYIWEFMTCSTSYSFHDTLMDPRYLNMHVCTRTYICTYMRMYVAHTHVIT